MLLFVALAMIADWGTPQPTMPSIGQLPERCVRQDHVVSGTAPTTGPRKLNEMPDAEPQFAVVRTLDGCPIPAKVNQLAARRR